MASKQYTLLRSQLLRWWLVQTGVFLGGKRNTSRDFDSKKKFVWKLFQTFIEESSEEGQSRKSPPESEKKHDSKPEVVINMPMPLLEVHTVGGVLVHMPHVSSFLINLSGINIISFIPPLLIIELYIFVFLWRCLDQFIFNIQISLVYSLQRFYIYAVKERWIETCSP